MQTKHGRAILVLDLLLATATLTTAADFGAEATQVPTRFPRLEAVGLGLAGSSGWPLMITKVGKASVVVGRLHVGTSVYDSYGAIDDWFANMNMPIQVGYSLYSNPKRTAFFYSAVPDIYLEASFALLADWHTHPSGRISLCGDVDYCGFGLRLELGFLHGGYDPSVYAGFQVRALTLGLGLN